MEWGFSNFQLIDFFKKGDLVFQADTWLGKDKTINLVAPSNISLSVSKAHLTDMEVIVQVMEPIPVPIITGDVIGQLKIIHGKTETLFDLIAEKDVKQKNIISKVFSALYYLVMGTN